MVCGGLSRGIRLGIIGNCFLGKGDCYLLGLGWLGVGGGGLLFLLLSEVEWREGVG